MPKTPTKTRLRTKKHKHEIKQEPKITKSNLSPNLQSFKQKILSGNSFVEYRLFFKYSE